MVHCAKMCCALLCLAVLFCARLAAPLLGATTADYQRPIQWCNWCVQVSHFASFIVLFGALINTHVGHLETFHKWMKAAYNRYTSKVEENLAQQIPKFFVRHSAYQTLRSYHLWRDMVQPAENVPPAAKRQRTVPATATSAHGCFYAEKGLPQRDLNLQEPNAPPAPVWDRDSLNIPSTRTSLLSSPSPPQIICGVPVAQVTCLSPLPVMHNYLQVV